MATFPQHVNGIDIETKSTEVNAYVLSIGMAKFRVRDLRLVETLSLHIDPECSIQTKDLNRHVSERTMEWWFPKKPTKWSPTEQAQKWTWGGGMSTDTALMLTSKYLRDCSKDKTMVHTMRGPDFDYVILKNLYDEMGLYLDLSFTALDSHRTVERALKTMGVGALSDKELVRISPADHVIEHVAVCDAAKEAYDTARYYHLLWWLMNRGAEKAKQVIAGWAEGNFEEIPNE